MSTVVNAMCHCYNIQTQQMITHCMYLLCVILQIKNDYILTALILGSGVVMCFL